jgi:hypothetical protein
MKTSNLSLGFAMFALGLLISPFSASGKKVGSFYCNAAKTAYPVTKADIRSTAIGFSFVVNSVAEIQSRITSW